MYISAIDVRMRLKDSVSTPKAQFMVRDPDDPSGKIIKIHLVIKFSELLWKDGYWWLTSVLVTE